MTTKDEWLALFKASGLTTEQAELASDICSPPPRTKEEWASLFEACGLTAEQAELAADGLRVPVAPPPPRTKEEWFAMFEASGMTAEQAELAADICNLPPANLHRRKSKPKKPAGRPQKNHMLVWHIADDKDMSQPLIQFCEQKIRQTLGVVISEDPLARRAQREMLAQLARMEAERLVGNLRNKKASGKPRENARKPLLAKIRKVMSAEKRTGVEFNTLMERWEKEYIGGLSMTPVNPDGGPYTFRDGNGDEEEFLPYKRSTLEKMYSKAAG